MAGVDPAARRQEGVSPLPASATRGSRGKGNDAGDAVNLPTTTLDERLDPSGSHVNRGVEANTNLFGSDSAPEFDTVTAGEPPVSGPPFPTPDSSGLLAGGDSGEVGRSDERQFSRPLIIPHDSFTGTGEPPYTKDQPDGRT